jgi:hypothetical protein
VVLCGTEEILGHLNMAAEWLDMAEQLKAEYGKVSVLPSSHQEEQEAMSDRLRLSLNLVDQ